MKLLTYSVLENLSYSRLLVLKDPLLLYTVPVQLQILIMLQFIQTNQANLFSHMIKSLAKKMKKRKINEIILINPVKTLVVSDFGKKVAWSEQVKFC